MTSSINDFNLAGIFCLLIGSLILAGFPSAAKDVEMEARSFLRRNPFIVKNQIIRKYERRIGILWLFMGTIFQIIRFSTTKVTPFWLSPTIEVIGLIIITAGILKMTPLLVYKISHWEFKPYMIESRRDAFERAQTILKNNGLAQDEVDRKDLTISEDVREKRLSSVGDSLNQIGRLIDILRKEGECDEEYSERLRPYFK